jgi:hypothetical protein
MMPSVNIDPKRLIGKRFRIKKLQYNTYEIDHLKVKGQLRLLSIPIKILQVPDDLIPADVNKSEFPTYVIGFQSTVAFTNEGEKKELQLQPPNLDLRTTPKEDITNYIVDQQTFEPWNEFILQGNPPIMIKTRTILSKLQWLCSYTDNFGDPSLWAIHNTTHSASHVQAGEAGMA